MSSCHLWHWSIKPPIDVYIQLARYISAAKLVDCYVVLSFCTVYVVFGKLASFEILYCELFSNHLKEIDLVIYFHFPAIYLANNLYLPNQVQVGIVYNIVAIRNIVFSNSKNTSKYIIKGIEPYPKTGTMHL